MACGVGIGGGHDNIARNNLAIECGCGVRIDARGVSRGYDKNPTLLKIIAAMNPTQPPWSDRFPTLAAISETLPPCRSAASSKQRHRRRREADRSARKSQGSQRRDAA